ncbi:MAG: Mu-like prophage major head subunit gpT family protein [Armatimonadetes bacterium]|nr:Mu-like prophage major head subunit gpT family protein [Armatimonadota bacterium]
MLVKGDMSALLLAGLKTQFFQTYQTQPAEWDKVATLIPSDKDTEHYAWLGALPGVREFLDERQVADFSEYEYQIKNKTWESTVAVDRTLLEDDQYGQVALRVKGLAAEAKQHLDILVFSLLAAGFTANCYDGTPFFGTHSVGKAQGAVQQSNQAPAGAALSSATLMAAITAMRRTLNDQGRPMQIAPDTLVVPPELEWEAHQLLNSVFFPDPVQTASQQLPNNPLRGLLRLVVTPYLTNGANWFLLDTQRAVRAVVLQMRRDFEFSALEANSEEGFLRDRYLYGVRARYNVGYGDWRCAYGYAGN